MNENLHVMIIEDDFRVAEINRQLVEQVTGYQVDCIAKTGEEALAYLRSASQLPDLILLDVFIPDRSGLQLFWEIRHHFHPIGIVILSAAKEVATVEETLRGGIFDYIVKPVDFKRFEQTLIRFSNQKALLASKMEMEQTDIDQLLGLTPLSGHAPIAAVSENQLPKGIDELTLIDVTKILRAAAPVGINAMEASKAVGVSRSTARRYLEHLVSIGKAKAQLNYGEIGRPERRYIPWTK